MMKKMTIFVMLALLAGCIKENHAPLADEDARLVTLLNQAASWLTVMTAEFLPAVTLTLDRKSVV